MSAPQVARYRRPNPDTCIAHRRALIIDRRAVLATDVCRSLARQGWLVDILGEKQSPAFRSRFCNRRITTPPWYSGKPFMDVLRRTVEEGHYEIILLCSEEIPELILPLIGTSPSWNALLLSRPECFRIVSSKSRSLQLAAQLGIPTPVTLFPTDRESLEQMGRQLGFPVVIKGEKGEAGQRVRYASSVQEVLSLYGEIAADEAGYGARPVLQEFVPGTQYSVGGLFDDGDALRICAYQKLFAYPVNGGLTAKAVTERPPELLENALALFKALKYTGLGQVQFIRDSRDGKFRFLEINPRIWGCVGLLQHAGVDIYQPYFDLVRGHPVRPDLSFQEGIVYHRLSVELRLILQQPRHAIDFIRDAMAGRDYWDFEWSDPGPHIPLVREFRKVLASRRAPLSVRTKKTESLRPTLRSVG